MHGQSNVACLAILSVQVQHTQENLYHFLSILQVKAFHQDHAGSTCSLLENGNLSLWNLLVVPAFSYHMGSIPAVCTPHWHLCCPRNHHRWCPKCRWHKPPLFHTCCHQTEVSKTYPDKELWKNVDNGSQLLTMYSCMKCSSYIFHVHAKSQRPILTRSCDRM